MRLLWLVFGIAVISGQAEGAAEKETGGKAAGEVMRVCRVSSEAGPEVVKMTLKRDDETEDLFVSKEPLLTERDVKKAWVDVGRAGIINVELKEAGGRKLSAATVKMELGVDRLALIAEGRLIAAPVVQDTLGSRFVLSGLKKNRKELEALAARIMGAGKPTEEDHEAPKPEGG